MTNTPLFNLTVVPCRSPMSRLSALGAKECNLPRSMPVLPWGETDSTRGKIRVTEHSAQTVPIRQKELGFDRVALDFEHNTVPGTPEYERTNEPRSVAGYCTPHVERGAGLLALDIKWLPDGIAFAATYPDLSATVELNENSEVTFVHSIAFTRHGAVPDSRNAGFQSYSTRLARAGCTSLDPANELRLLKSLRVLPWGKCLGRAVVDFESLELLPINQRQFGGLRVPVYLPGQILAATGKVEVKNCDGVHLTELEWSPQGRDQALEFSHYIPSVLLSPSLRVVGLSSVELAHDGGVPADDLMRLQRLNARVAAENRNLPRDVLAYEKVVAGFAALARKQR